MTSYILTYDLVREESSAAYKPLIDELMKHGAHKYQMSTWLIALNNTATEVYDYFNQFLDANDKLMVSELTPNHKQARNFKGTNDWIAKNLVAR